MPKLLPIFLLMAAVFISGCVSDSVEKGNGVAIKDFEPDFPTVKSGDEIDFDLRIKNTGSLVAENIEVQILGIEEWPEYLNPGLCEEFSLLPPSESGIEGQSKACRFTYRAIEISPGLSIKYEPTARVFYDYSTTTIHGITIYSKNELRTLQDQGRALPTEMTSTSRGPVSVKLSTKQSIVASEDSVTFPLEIEVENIGGGVACTPNNCKLSEKWNSLELRLLLGKDMISDCTTIELSLYRGAKNSVTCQVTATRLPVFGFSKRQIEAKAAYDYFIEKTTEITVEG